MVLSLKEFSKVLVTGGAARGGPYVGESAGFFDITMLL